MFNVIGRLGLNVCWYMWFKFKYDIFQPAKRRLLEPAALLLWSKCLRPASEDPNFFGRCYCVDSMGQATTIIRLTPCPLLTHLTAFCQYWVTMIMASGPINSWEIDGETVETVVDFTFLGSKITVDGDCSHEIRRRLLLGRKVMTNLDSILKSRDITLPTKVCLVKAMVFPVVMYACDSWTVK